MNDPLDEITLSGITPSATNAPANGDSIDAINLLSTPQPTFPQTASPLGQTNIPYGGIQRVNAFNLPEEIPDAERGYLAKNQRPGMPLDIHDEVGAMVGLMGSLRRDPSDRLKYLIDVFGPENVRPDDRGEPIIRITDPETRKQKEIWFNARGLSVNDLMTVVSAIPQAIGAYVGMRGGRALPKVGAATGAKGFLRDVLGGALGSETVGAGQDVGVRMADQQPIRPGEIAQTRLANVPIAMVSDYALAGAGKVLQGGVNAARIGGNLAQGNIPVPVNLNRFRGQTQTGALQGQQAIRGATGIEYPLGPHETMGVPFLAQAWEYLRNYPSSAKAVQLFQDEKDIATRAFQEFMYSPGTLESDEVLGRQIIELLDTVKAKRAQALATQAADSGTRLQTALKDTGKSISTARPRQDYNKLGGTIRNRIVALRDAAKEEQNIMRQNIAAMPGGTGKVFDSVATGLTSNAQKVLDALPAPETIINTPSGLLDQFGKPVMVSKVGKVLEKHFVPDKVVERLKSLTQDKKFSLSDLIQMRSDVYEDIAAGQAVPNTGTHYLNNVGKMLTETIEKGIDLIPNPQLKKALLAANKQYKDKVIPFESSGISHLFKNITEPGYVGNVDAIKLLTGDSEKYLRTVQFLGKNSPEHEQLKRGIFEQVLRESSDDGLGKSINAEALISKLRELASNAKTRNMFQDVFGKQAEKMTKLSETMRTVERMGKGNISGDDVAKLLADPNAKMFGFVSLVRQANTNAKLYKNRIIKDLVSGDFDPARINPDEFIDKFLTTGSLSDVRQVWGFLSHYPDVQEQIARKQIQRIFTQGERFLEPEDIAARARGELTHIVSSKGLIKAMGSADDVAKLEAVIGKDRVDLLHEFTKIKAAEDWALSEGGGTGILTKGSATGGVLRQLVSMVTSPKTFNPAKISKEVASLLGYKAIAVLLTSRALSRITSSTFTPAEMPGLFEAIIVSEPFIRAVIEDSPDDQSAYEVLGAAKRMSGVLNQ